MITVNGVKLTPATHGSSLRNWRSIQHINATTSGTAITSPVPAEAPRQKSVICAGCGRTPRHHAALTPPRPPGLLLVIGANQNIHDEYRAAKYPHQAQQVRIMDSGSIADDIRTFKNVDNAGNPKPGCDKGEDKRNKKAFTPTRNASLIALLYTSLSPQFWYAPRQRHPALPPAAITCTRIASTTCASLRQRSADVLLHACFLRIPLTPGNAFKRGISVGCRPVPHTP